MNIEALNISTSTSESITLYDLQRMVRGSLESRFHDPLWISAEISELKLNRSGHCYLNLVEKGATDGAPRAEARAVIWRTTYLSIASMFEASTGSPLRAGLSVLIRVVVSYHEIYGFSLQIIDLDPSFTLGDVERRRRETIARLEADGVWDMNRELQLPHPTLRIAIISSATAAGYQDFMRELQRTFYRFRVTLFESLMQGESAEHSVICALEDIAEREEEFDAVAIIRGGGSTSDLALFDSYRIASHVAQFPLPVITGIGHDKDISVVDMVAHTSCKTPTAVATLFAELADSDMLHIETMATELHNIVERRLNNETLRIYRFSSDITRLVSEQFSEHQHRLQMAKTQIYELAKLLIHNQSMRLDKAFDIATSYSIDNILQLGFAVLRHGDNAIRSISEVIIGDDIDVELADGRVRAEITKIEKKS